LKNTAARFPYCAATDLHDWQAPQKNLKKAIIFLFSLFFENGKSLFLLPVSGEVVDNHRF
jgi:hypothetical protein